LAETCQGPGACKVSGGNILCDNDIAKAGDPCRDEGDFACTTDKRAALKCQGKKMVTINSCRGPKSCSIVHPTPKQTDIDCDMSIAAVNDPCAFNDSEACTSDRRTKLTCKDNKYAVAASCSSPNGCSVKVTGRSFKVSCDAAPAAVP
jgi:hypothetical protein